MIAAKPTYRFVRIKVHPKLELSSWYLVIERADIDLMMNMHRSAAQTMFMRFHRDPHLYDQKTWKPVSDRAEFYNPIRLSAGWLRTVETGLLMHGVVYMNLAHGIMFGANTMILEERDSETLDFPKDEQDNHKEGVSIVISKWGDGQHFYLSSNTGQVFTQPKFNTLPDAMTEARKHAFENRITVKTDHHNYREGD